MRIATKDMFSAFAGPAYSTALGLVLVMATVGHAHAAPPPLGTPVAVVAPAVVTPPAAAPAPVAVEATPSIALPTASDTVADDVDSDAKASNSVKNVIKRLDRSVDNVNASDVNAARQAIARVDILIELEKKLAELDKVRNMKDDSKSSGGFSGRNALASVGGVQPITLAPPPMIQPMPMPMASIAPPPPSFTVARISGAAGAYSAVLAMADGNDKTVRVGDALSGGEKVVDIDSGGVIVDRDGQRHAVRIKNVNRIFGNTP